MYENTLKIALNSTCMKDLNKNVLPYVYLALFRHSCGSGVGFLEEAQRQKEKLV